ncbi:class F sortase [Nonomuraea sp. NPDC049504]|uniref:class F sortase n=1 Tax=Nonomuraea sp. NPDC049504 TaxID=3154729 RepID=UPI003425EA40
MAERRPGRRRCAAAWAAVAVVLVAAGTFLLLSARQGPGPPPVAQPAPSATSAPAGTVELRPLLRSAPTRLLIPSIEVDAPVVAMGLNADGAAGEPPLSKPYLVSWFADGAAPGEIGVAAFYGHVDSRRSGPAVFYRVAQLQRGALVQVPREDGRTATFHIYTVERYPKSDFPTDHVYGETDRPEIRLITCGGSFDSTAGSYRDNIVAFGALTDDPA